MSVGTAFHPRTSPLNRKMQWREWSGYFASSVYADAHDIEYNAIREAAALIDVSPALQVPRRRAGRPPPGRPGGHPRRDEARGRRRHLHALVRRARQGRRRRHRPPPRRTALPLDGGRPAAPLAAPEQRRARRDHHEESESDGRAGPPGSAVTGRPGGSDRRVVRRPALLPAARLDRSARSPSTCRGPATRAISATSCGSRHATRSRSGTRSIAAGRDYGIRPAGMLALDVVRLEAGLDPASRSTTRPRATR